MIAVVTYKMLKDWTPWTFIFPCNYSHLFDPRVGEYRILYYDPDDPKKDLRVSIYTGTKSLGNESMADNPHHGSNIPVSSYEASNWTSIAKFNCLWISFAIYSYLKHKEKYA